MNEKGKEIYDEVKEKVQKTKKNGTLEKKFADFWRIACKGKYKVYDIQYKYDDSTKEFVEKHKEQLTTMRKDFLENIEGYVNKCIESLENNNFTVHYAKTNEDAQDLFLEEIRGHDTIYKSKSNEAKDIGLLEVLKKNNITIKETDLGDVLVQLFDYQLPSYQLGPGVHFDEQDIVDKIKEKYDVELKPTPHEIVKFFRKTYRKELLNDVKVSLTSANAISADDGSILLVENEGNISLLTRATDKHIVVVGITKIVPTIFDALLVAKVQERINNAEISYINFITSFNLHEQISTISISVYCVKYSGKENSDKLISEINSPFKSLISSIWDISSTAFLEWELKKMNPWQNLLPREFNFTNCNDAMCRFYSRRLSCQWNMA